MNAERDAVVLSLKSLLRRRSLAVIAAMTFVAVVLLFILFDIVSPADLHADDRARVVLAADGTPLRAFADQRGVWRYETDLTKVSPYYLKCLINYEDRWFYHHPGVNPLALLRAAGQWVTEGRIVSGGSTLTMQVARLRFGLKSSFADKFMQIVRALQLERHYSKEQILNYYLNHAPFGGPLEGVEAASRSYFGYSAADLTLAQSALLAVLPQAPSRYRPDRYPHRAQVQRDKVLKRLVDFNVIAPGDAADAVLESVESGVPRLQVRAPLLARRLSREQSGRVVLSYIDRDLQGSIEKLARSSEHLIPQRASLAVMVMEHGSGKVVAYVGSQNFYNSERFGHVDMVAALRSPGSTLKPFIYGLALDQGLIHSESLLMDVPLSFGDYRPRNFNRGFSGPVSVSSALRRSLNIPAVQVLEQTGAETFYAQLQNAGAGLRLPRQARPNLSLALGGVATSLEHLVRLYSALGNGGETLKPRFGPEDSNQRVKLLSPGSAWIVREMLYPRKSSWRSRSRVAVKTGTSYAFRDTWALAVSDQHTIGVWVGRPDNAAMTGHFGRITAEPLARAVAGLLPRTDYASIKRPESVSRQTICWPGGQDDKHYCDERHLAWILDKTIPPTLMTTLGREGVIGTSHLTFDVARGSGLRVPLGCDLPSQSVTVALWPAALQGWIDQERRNSSRIPELDSHCQHSDGLLPESPLSIIGIDEGARIRPHAGTQQRPRLNVAVVGGQGQWSWLLNDQLIQSGSRHLRIDVPPPGRYRLMVIDQSGMSDSLEFIVEP